MQYHLLRPPDDQYFIRSSSNRAGTTHMQVQNRQRKQEQSIVKPISKPRNPGARYPPAINIQMQYDEKSTISNSPN